jgi:Raf kinase inhibitor-like YbhB/YbcL family protein
MGDERAPAPVPTTSSRRRSRPARRCALAVAALLLAAGAPAGRSDPAAFALRSPAFEPGAGIPSRHTCEGEDVSPPLSWSEPPAGTRSFALVVDDPDAPDPAAPKRTWVHWVVYGIPGDARALAEGAGERPAGGRSGRNDWGRAEWGGPCPPIGRHRYVHTLYALDADLGDLGAPTKAELQRALEGHVLGRAELVGTYQKQR